MNIIHYNLGFSPYRTGGLTKYSLDLAYAQVKLSHNVYHIWPGKIKLFGKKTSFKVSVRPSGLKSIELINPQLIPLLNGIHEPQEFMRNTKVYYYEEIFNKSNQM